MLDFNGGGGHLSGVGPSHRGGSVSPVVMLGEGVAGLPSSGAADLAACWKLHLVLGEFYLLPPGPRSV